MIIGLGPHSQKSYLPVLKELFSQGRSAVVYGVDLISQKETIDRYLLRISFDIPMFYLDQFQDRSSLPDFVENKLDEIVDENDVQGVIIATEPLVHKAYAKWALKKGLHILMDKPVSTRMNVVTDITEAKGIADDYLELLQDYRKLQDTKETIFSIMVQRRYDKCHEKVISLIKEVAEKFNAPVTSIQAMHADGQWRLPSEIVTQEYHPYCQGYGKCSHSGYHFFDIVYKYFSAGYREAKKPDSAEVFSSFVEPTGFLKQFGEKDYANYFGEEYKNVKKWSDEELEQLYRGYGEMDAFSIIRLMKDKTNICNVSLNLLHNSFARRDWILPGTDLYKGNGRVKHQYFQIQQGPFQNIQVHSYQVSDRSDSDTEHSSFWGGNSHFDIHLFRNIGMFSEGEKAFQQYSIKDIYSEETSDDFHPNDFAKKRALLELLDFIEGRIQKKELISNIEDHFVPVHLMSSVYLSHIHQNRQKDPIIRFSLD